LGGYLDNDFFFGGGGVVVVSRCAATTLIAALSLGNYDITRFRSWSPVARVNHLDRAEKTPNVVQTTGIVGNFDPHSGVSRPTWRIAFACPNLQELQTQTSSSQIPSCSVIDLAQIRRSSKVNLSI